MALLVVGAATSETPTSLLPIGEYDLFSQLVISTIGTVKGSWQTPTVGDAFVAAIVTAKFESPSVDGSFGASSVVGKATWATVGVNEEPAP
jgi:hypothetical protein